MSRYTAEVVWTLDRAAEFSAHRYSRRHELRFDGGARLPASSSPQVVPLPWSDAAAVDPEELFVASLASCHMLWFLDLAARAGWQVASYHDHADGLLARDTDGRQAMTQVTLHPAAAFAGEPRPDAAEIRRLHHQAHERCFIAHSVKTDVRCEPVLTD